jgi:hypothetical protein
MLSKDFKEFVELLKKHEAEYMMSVAMPSASMATQDSRAIWTFGCIRFLKMRDAC